MVAMATDIATSSCCRSSTRRPPAAGGAAGIGSNVNPDFDKAHFAISFQWHKQAMEMLVTGCHPDQSRDAVHDAAISAASGSFLMDNLGADVNGVAINNKWGNKGQFAAWFKYYTRPLHYEFARVYFHKREQFCIPQIDTCSTDPGYPHQDYSSTLPSCPAPDGEFGTGVPTGSEDGPIPPATP